MSATDDRSPVRQDAGHQDSISGDVSGAAPLEGAGEPRAQEPGGGGVSAGGTAGDEGVTYESQEPGDATESLKREVESQRDRYLRLAAEYDNFRKRTQRERAEAGSRAQAELVQSLLEALDDLDRFAEVDPATTTAATVIEGVTMVQRKLAKALGAAGLEVIDPQGSVFDPADQEAMTTTPAATPEEDHTVAQVYQLGYRFAGQLLRPARVVVRQWQG